MYEIQEETSAVFLSNQLAKLADGLGQKLFDPSKHPLERKLVLVPSLRIKEYLLHYFAHHPVLNIAAGIEVYCLEEGVHEILRSSGTVLVKEIPSSLELSFNLEHLIDQFASSGETELEPLFKYLGESRQRRIALCDQLAQLFLRYGTYGAALLEKWSEEGAQKEAQGWQSFLWRQLFSPESPWTWASCALENRVDPGFTVHLFGFSFLPQSYVSFFKRLKSIFYLLSPCSLFWGDLYSDRQRMALKKMLERRKVPLEQIEQWDSYVKDNNPLLANWGKLGRAFLSALEIEDLQTEEEYIPNPPHQLGSVQDDVLMLVSKSEEVGRVSDGSIQIHSATSLLREVEILHQVVCTLIQQNHLSPKDIVVLAPNICVYAPFIHFVFGHAECKLEYMIGDLELSSQSAFISAFQDLLHLPQDRFELFAVLKMLSHENIRRNFHFSLEDVARMRKWLMRTDMKWGIDAEQRQAFVAGVEAQGSWQQAIDRLIWGLVMLSPKEDAFAWPLAAVDINEVQSLDKLVELLKRLKQDLKAVYDGENRSISTWLGFFKTLAKTYFPSDNHQEAFLIECNHLDGKLKHLQNTCYSFESARRFIDRYFSQKSGLFYSSPGQTIRFSSLSEGAIVPADTIYLLGMEEGSFPRQQLESSLCELGKFPGDSQEPTRTDVDRMLFLEALLCAKNHFMMSYQRIHAEDHEPQSPSLLVQELSSYLGSKEGLTTHHPALSFHKTEFQGTPSFSQKQFMAAMAHYAEKKEDAPAPASSILPITTDLVVDIKELLQCARNPIQFYCNQALGLYLPTEKNEGAQKEFVLPALERSFFRKGALEHSLEQMLHSADKLGMLPLSGFKEVSRLKITEEVQELEAFFNEFNVPFSKRFSIELRQDCTETYEYAPRHYHVPALHIPVGRDYTAVITGKLSDLSPQGLIVHGSLNGSDLLKHWPAFLVYLALSKVNIPWKPFLLLSKDGKIRNAPKEDPLLLLANYIVYCQSAKRQLSPLMPHWGVALLEGSCADFEKKVAATLDSAVNSYEDPYVKWMFLREPSPCPKELFAQWAEPLRALFPSLKEVK
jgi:exodeoxyribonuclease V gamma subunit